MASINLSTLSPSEANPSIQGLHNAYSSAAVVVAWATSFSYPRGRLGERRVRSATIEASHLTTVSSKCNVIPRLVLSITPSTFICITLSAPGDHL